MNEVTPRSHGFQRPFGYSQIFAWFVLLFEAVVIIIAYIPPMTAALKVINTKTYEFMQYNKGKF